MKEIKLKVKGMMCQGCENRVKNALKNIYGVEKVSANHTIESVIVVCNDIIDPKAIKEAVEDIGYKIIGND